VLVVVAKVEVVVEERRPAASAALQYETFCCWTPLRPLSLGQLL
jgi:hypothetical protein